MLEGSADLDDCHGNILGWNREILSQHAQCLSHLRSRLLIVWDGLFQPLPKLGCIPLHHGPAPAIQARDVVQLTRIAVMQEDLLKDAAPWVPGLQMSH